LQVPPILALSDIARFAGRALSDDTELPAASPAVDRANQGGRYGRPPQLARGVDDGLGSAR
jgi:hypothetical protein